MVYNASRWRNLTLSGFLDGWSDMDTGAYTSMRRRAWTPGT